MIGDVARRAISEDKVDYPHTKRALINVNLELVPEDIFGTNYERGFILTDMNCWLLYKPINRMKRLNGNTGDYLLISDMFESGRFRFRNYNMLIENATSGLIKNPIDLMVLRFILKYGTVTKEKCDVAALTIGLRIPVSINIDQYCKDLREKNNIKDEEKFFPLVNPEVGRKSIESYNKTLERKKAGIK